MSLPPRIQKQGKRESRWKSPAHLAFVRSHQCCVPGCTAMPIEAMHVRRGSGAGMGQKPDDWRTVSGCRDHHGEQHRIGEQSFEKRYGLDLAELAAEFAKASPKAAEIRKVQRERSL